MMNTLRPVLISLLILTTACRRPSTQFAAMLSPVSQVADYTRYLKAGDELVALGNDPVWSLSINPSKGKLTVKLDNGDSLTTAIPERQTDSDGVIRYNTQVESRRLNIVFRPDSCVDARAKQRYDYQVQVDANGKNYMGCGVSLQKVALLQDSWVLTQYQGHPVTVSGPTNDVPRLDISLTEGRVTGTTGCNRLNGTVKADTRLIQFGPMAMTRMVCAGQAGTFETAFLNLLIQPLSYQVGEGTLTFLQNNKPIMTFKKVD